MSDRVEADSADDVCVFEDALEQIKVDRLIAQLGDDELAELIKWLEDQNGR